MTDSKKENRWAKVLADAGLLDEIDDAWELSGSDLKNAVIEVKGSGGARIPTSVSPSRRLSAPAVTADDTQRITTISDSPKPSKPRRDDESTVRISTREKDPFNPEGLRVSNARKTVSGLPFTPVRPSEEPIIPPLPVPPEKRETNPAPYARHSQGALPYFGADDEHQRETIEVDNPEEAYHSFRGNEQAQSRPTVSDASSGYDELSASLARLQEQGDVRSQDQVVSVCGARISVAMHSPRAGVNTGSIIDEPWSMNEELELIPLPDDDPSPISIPPPSLRQQMVERYDVGDFSGTLDIVTQILKDEPNNLDALNYSRAAKETLLRMYESRIGDMSRVPRLLVSTHELMWRNLDPASGFILSRFDGMSSFEDVVDISGLPRFETCRIFSQLLQDGIIA